MINLLPKDEKERIKKDFYFRFAIVLFMTIGICVLIASALVVPSYFFSIVQKEAVNKRLAEQKQSPVPQNEEVNSIIIKELNQKLSLIESVQKNKFVVSQKIINDILLHKTPEIKITSITYTNDSTEKKVIITGIAPSREKLLFFRKALEDDVSFKKIDLPISNFVKGSNIQFSMHITPS